MANFYARIAEAAARFPDRPAIEVLRSDGLETTTYAALIDEAAHVGGWLAGQGVARGDRVAILADNDAGWIAAYLGVLRLGAVVVPLDTNYQAGQVRTVIDNSGARVCLTTPRYLDTAREALATEGARCGLALLGGQTDDLPGPDDFKTAAPLDTVADAAGDDAAVILYTSGTTSDPKGVVLTHRNLDAERQAAFEVVSVSEADAVLGVLPLFHALAEMANLLLPLSVGARVVFLESISSTTLLEALQTRGITLFACVPQFFYLIHERVQGEVARGGPLARGAFRALVGANAWLRDRIGWNPGRRVFARVHRVLGPTMRILVTGGSRFDPAIARDLYGLGFTLLNAYGLTETSGGACIVRPGDRFTTSVGQPFPGVEVQIEPKPQQNEEHRVSFVRGKKTPGVVSGGDDGEVLIRGPIVMREYYRRADATAEALDDGWLRTGDLGRLDDEGRLYITGRKKEVIVLASGKNLYPEEIEAHYRQSPFVGEICVLGRARAGAPAAERLHAVVVADQSALRQRGVVNVRELIRFELEGLSVRLPAHKRVLSFDVWTDPLPRTTTGKIKRHEVERRLAAEDADASAAAERPLTDDEARWLADPAHAPLAAAITSRVGARTVRPDANLELDLGLDSMERVELLTTLERQAGTRVAAEARAAIFTVRELVDAVRSAPAAGANDGPTGDDDLAWDAVLAEPPDPALVANLSKPKTVRAVLLFVCFRLAALPLRLAIGFRATGRAHLPTHGPFIISPNHQTYLDGALLVATLPFAVFRRLFLVGAAEYFERPTMRRLAAAANIVPVDPNANLITAMRAGAAGLRLGKVLVLFPEGERSIDGELKPFRKGAAILASHLQAPILPVALDGLFPVWPRGRPLNWRALLPWRGTRVRLTFGPPIPVARGAYDEGTAALRQAVEGMFHRLRRDG